MSENKLPSQQEGLFAEHKEELDEEWHEAFDALTAQGKAPSSIKATIEYATTKKSQSEVSDEFNVSEVTIRNLMAAIIALGPVDEVIANHQSGMRKMDYCNHLADRFGWEEGVEYTVTKNGYYDTPSPSLNKAGWKSVYEAISDE